VPDPSGAGASQSGDPGSMNRYAYVQGDPVNFGDPSGQVSISVCAINGIPCARVPACDPFSGNSAGGCVDPDANPCAVGGMGFNPMAGVACFQVRVTPPRPQPKPVASCSIGVATSGTPRNQNISQVGATPPGTNQLGAYSPTGENAGWFFGYQVQASLAGDTDPSDWLPGQWVSTSGFVWDGVSNHSFDSPQMPDHPSPGAVYQATGVIDWLDAPGILAVGAGIRVVGADITFNFEFSVRSVSNASCSTTLRLHLKPDATWSVN
jgi:hypothetical protein